MRTDTDPVGPTGITLSSKCAAGLPILPDWVSARNFRASSGDNSTTAGPAAIASTNCCVAGSSNGASGKTDDAFIGLSMGYARLLHPERSPDQAPTNRCEILQNPGRRRKTTPQAVLNFSRSGNCETAKSGPGPG